MTSHGKKDQDQSLTIEFLRARLLAERSVSQTARQRADELAERVLELEEQLKIVSLQRKKAEKATAAVLSILENQGISDASQEFNSGSDQEAESADNRNERNPTSSNLKEKENDADISSSDIVSSPSTGRSLSWKSGKSFDRKKYTDSVWRRSSSFRSPGTNSPKQAGKSCRRVRRSNTKSATDELQNTSGGCPPECLPSFANNGPQSLMDSNGNNDVKGTSEMSENQRKENECDEDMERALQHKAQLIGKYVAEEKAQREWEEKYRENNSYAQDSCDPGNYSDVTEERDDGRSYSAEMINLQNHANEFRESDIPSTYGVTDNFPSTPNSRIINAKSPASEFALPKSNGSWPENNGPTPAYSHHQCLSVNGSRIHPSEHTISSSGGSGSQEGRAFEGDYEQANNIGSILGALDQAKFSINQQINVSSVTKGGSSIEHSIPTTRIEDRLDIPPGCPGLFRLPTDFQPSQRPILENTLGTGFDYLNPPSILGLPFCTKSTYPTYPFYPNTTTTTMSRSQASWSPLYEPSLTTFCPVVVPNLSSGEEVFLRSLPRNESGIPPSFPVSHYDAHMRPNMYR
ncbi:uncharacterized protein LOC132640099 [Lycium barbarum]|uniref:uncharacterized protein LOC132640099 n=1 Tax=Lycium barbarum TaxID=112863 RepID=UPI00293F1137|nr:uncharacterized protein LOC132640099 [Lycium barbarum]XP_060212517.1 uncharacterized protein LOC132640099 [Lycium barbarum]